MSQSVTRKAAALGFAAMLTLTLVFSLDAIARTEHSMALLASGTAAQVACVAPARAS